MKDDASSLSDKISVTTRRWNRKPYSHLKIKDVKESVKKLKEDIKLQMHFDSMDAGVHPEIEIAALISEIDKIFGSALI